MADLFARIKPKKSSTPGEVPSPADLEVSELAVNTADGKLFTKHTDNTIKTIAGTGGGAVALDDLTDVDTSTVAPTDGQVLAWVDANSQWEPATPSGGGASNIVDQGDYSPRYDAQAPTWTANTTATSGSQLAAGEAALTTPFYIYLELKKIDKNGVDRSAGLAGLALTNVLTIKYNGGASSVTKTITGSGVVDNGTYVTIEVNNSSEPWANGEALEITGGTLTSSPIEIPKSTGDILTWNGTTSKFEPTPVPADTVTSVNGQTGDVALDLLDINDVTGLVGTVYRYNNFVNSSANVNSAGKYYKQGFTSPEREVLYVYSTDSDGNSIYNQALASPTGTAVWWKSDTVTTWQQSTLYSDAGAANPGTCTFTINEPPTVATGGIGVGVIYLTFADPTASVYDEQVLTWNGGESLWKPAYTRIQSSSDYLSNSVAGASWTISTVAANGTGSGMIVGNGYQTTTGYRVHPTSLEGDQKASMRAWIATLTLPTTITFVLNGVEIPASVTAISDEADSAAAAYVPRFVFTCTAAAQDSYVGQTLVIKEYDTYLGAGDVPLAAGDFLRHDGTHFRPVQGITLATLKAEVAASTDFADFQARIAAL